MTFLKSLAKNAGKGAACAIIGAGVVSGGCLLYRRFSRRAGHPAGTTTPLLAHMRHSVASFPLIGTSEDDLEPLADAEALSRLQAHLRTYTAALALRLDVEEEQRLAFERINEALRAYISDAVARVDAEEAAALAASSASINANTTAYALQLDAEEAIITSLAPKKTQPAPLIKEMPAVLCRHSDLPCADTTRLTIANLADSKVLDDLKAQVAAPEDEVCVEKAAAVVDKARWAITIAGIMARCPDGNAALSDDDEYCKFDFTMVSLSNGATAVSARLEQRPASGSSAITDETIGDSGGIEGPQMAPVNVTAGRSDLLRRSDSAASGATSGDTTPLSAQASVLPGGPFDDGRILDDQDRPKYRLGRGLDVAAAEFTLMTAAPAPVEPAVEPPTETAAETQVPSVSGPSLNVGASTFVPTTIRKANLKKRRGKSGTPANMFAAVVRAGLQADKEEKARLQAGEGA